MDKDTKQVSLIPMHESMIDAGAADLFLQWVVQCYGMVKEIIVNNDPCFMSAFW